MGFLFRALINLFIRHREKSLGRPLTSGERNTIVFVSVTPLILFAAFCFYMAYGRHRH